MSKKWLIVATCAGLSISLVGCSNNKKDYDGADIVITMNDSETEAVSELDYATVNTYVRLSQAETYSLNEQMFSAYGVEIGSSFWADEASSDDYKTYGAEIKANILTEIETAMLSEEMSSEYGVSLSDEEREKCEEIANAFIADSGEEVIDAIRTDKDAVVKTIELLTIKEKVKAKIETTINTEITDKESVQNTFEYATLSKNTFDDPEATAENLINEAASSDFDTVTAELGLTPESASYTAANPEYDKYSETNPGLLENAVKIEEGDYTYYTDENGAVVVIYMSKENDESATQSKKEEIIESRKADAYNTAIESWNEIYAFDVNKSAWDSIKISDDAIFTEYVEHQTETESISKDNTETEKTAIDEEDSSLEVNIMDSDEETESATTENETE